MSVEIKESRIIHIEQKVITLSNVQELAKLVHSEYQKADSSKELEINFEVEWYNDSKFQSESPKIFDDDSTITKKRVRTILMEFSNGDKQSLTISLEHGNTDEEGWSENYIELGGDDPTWVSSINDKINLVFDSFQPQESIILKRRKLIMWSAFILGTSAFGPIIDLWNRNDENFTHFWSEGSIEDLFVTFSFSAVFGGFIVLFFVGRAVDYAEKLWPNIEIQIGPKHSYIEKRRRNLGWLIVSGLIIPVILTIASIIVSNL